MKAPTFPPLFRELDRVAAECFEFLVSETGCTGPTVEYWRDYFLTYRVREDVSVKVGMERDWPVPVIYLEYKNDGHVIFEIRQVLEAMEISIDSSQFSTIESLAESGWSKGILSGIPEDKLKAEWSLYLIEYSRALRARFDEFITFVTSKGAEQAKSEEATEGETGRSRFIGTVLQRAGEARTYEYVVAPGGFFLKRQFLPCAREDFWKIVDKDYIVSYSSGTCPSCGYVGNGGLREKQTVASKIFGAANNVFLLLLAISIVGLIVAAIWYRSVLMQLGLVAIGAFVFFELTYWAERRVFEQEFFCPNCGLSGSVPKHSDDAA